MSWGQWPGAPVQQPPVVAAAAPLVNPAPSVIPPGMPYTSDQWTQMQQQNWQQWAQWQQQYQQWHQQYGAEYQKSINALAAQQTVVSNMAVPPPLPVDPQPQPPLPKEEGPKPAPPLPVPVPPPQQPPLPVPSYTTQPLVPTHFNAPPPSFTPQAPQPSWKPNTGTPDQKRLLSGSEDSVAKRQMTNRQGWPNTNVAPPAPNQNEELSEAEKKFDKQFAEWETQFNKWKEQNSGHPDKQQYKEYEKKWEQWRQQLLDRREAMRRKRLGLPPIKPSQGQNSNAPPTPQPLMSQPPPPQFQGVKNTPPPSNPNVFSKPPPDMNNEPLQFKSNDKESEPKEEGVGFLNTSRSDGIPGLDLVKEGDSDKMDEEEQVPPQRGPDLEAISKGINNILGDQKLMSMLSMVSQNQGAKPGFPMVGGDQSNASMEDARKEMPEPIQNFDDQTRSSFTLQPNDDCYRTPLNKTQFGGRGPPPNFNENEMLYSRPPPNFSMPSVEDLKRPPPGRFQNDSDKPGLFDRAPPTPQESFGRRGPALLQDPEPNVDFRGTPGRGPFGQEFPTRGRGNFNEMDDFKGPGNFGPRGRPDFEEERGFGGRPPLGRDLPPRNSVGKPQFGEERWESFDKPPQRFGPDRDDFNEPPPTSFRGRMDESNAPNFRGRMDESNAPNFRGRMDESNAPNFRGRMDEPNFRGRMDESNAPNFRGRMDESNAPNFRGRMDEPNAPNFRGRMDESNAPNFRGRMDEPNLRGRMDESNFRGRMDEPNFRGRVDEPNGPNFGGRMDASNFRGRMDDANFRGRMDEANGDFRQRGGNFEPERFDDYPMDRSGPGRFGGDLGPKYGQRGFAEEGDYPPPPRGCFDAGEDAGPMGDAPEPPQFSGDMFEEEVAPPNAYVEEPALEDIWKPAKVIDYEHKRLKPPELDILVQPFRMFDYRHKPLRRIPYPERPNWLSDSVKMIPEFDPPIIRPPVIERRMYEDRYEPMMPRREDRNNFRPDERFKYERKGYDSRFSPPNVKYEESDWSGRGHRARSPPRFEKPPMGGDRDRDSWDRNAKRKWEEDDSFRADRSYERERRDRRDERDDDNWKGRDVDWDDKRKYRNQDMELERKDGRFKPDNRNDQREAFNRRDVESVFPFNKPIDESKPVNVTLIEDLLNAPGRLNRPQRIVIILRGPPGSGKTHLAKMIKDKEVENGGSAPRILSLDDYFMVEQEKEVVEDGKRVKLKEMVYEFEAEMEESYRISLMRSFKKTITDGYFPFIIVDNVNDKVKYFGEMWSFAKQNGFQVYICQLDLDIQNCTRRNIHNRTEEEIRLCIEGWETTPSHHPILDVTSLLQGEPIPEVEMEEINSPANEVEENEGSEHDLMASANPPAPQELWKSFYNSTTSGKSPDQPNKDRKGFGGLTWKNGNNRRR